MHPEIMEKQMQALVVLVPALVMALGELSPSTTLPKMVQAASQNLSAGLILGSLSGEIQPLVSSLVTDNDATGPMRLLCFLAILLGSCLSLALSFVVGAVADGECFAGAAGLHPAH